MEVCPQLLEEKHGEKTWFHFLWAPSASLQSPGIIAGIIKAHHPTSPRHQNSSHTLDKFSQENISFKYLKQISNKEATLGSM